MKVIIAGRGKGGRIAAGALRFVGDLPRLDRFLSATSKRNRANHQDNQPCSDVTSHWRFPFAQIVSTPNLLRCGGILLPAPNFDRRGPFGPWPDPTAMRFVHQLVGDFSAFKSLVPSGVPHPVQASQPLPAWNCPSSNPSVSLFPSVMSRSTAAGPIVP